MANSPFFLQQGNLFLVYYEQYKSGQGGKAMGYAKPGRRIYEKKYYSSLLNTEVVKEKALCYTYLHHMRVDNGSASCYT